MPNRYPQEAMTRDGRRLLIRPMTAADGDALYEFFMRLPEASRRFAWNRIEDRATRSRWSVAGVAEEGELRGTRLRPVEHGVYFAFAWLAFEPDTRIVRDIAIERAGPAARIQSERP